MNVQPLIVGFIAQGARLSQAAAVETGDLNEAYLIVHGVMARALKRHAANKSEQNLDLALKCALIDWRGGVPRSCLAAP